MIKSNTSKSGFLLPHQKMVAIYTCRHVSKTSHTLAVYIFMDDPRLKFHQTEFEGIAISIPNVSIKSGILFMFPVSNYKFQPYYSFFSRPPVSARMRTSRSHESLLIAPSMFHTVDLTAKETDIRPLHHSLLNQNHCFQVSNKSCHKYYSCRSAAEREKWLQR
jgi:hypothetical protein